MKVKVNTVDKYFLKVKLSFHSIQEAHGKNAIPVKNQISITLIELSLIYYGLQCKYILFLELKSIIIILVLILSYVIKVF